MKRIATLDAAVDGHDPALSIRGLSRHHDQGDGRRVEALSGIDLEIPTGEIVALLGPSGCGKTTLLDTIAGLASPDAGKVLIEGLPARPGRSGHLPQRDLLMPWMDVLDNVALALRVRGIARAEARRRADAQLRRFGLVDMAGRAPQELSGGMRQRAAFARTLLAEPSLLLLDEPFAALDSLTRIGMQDWLYRHWRETRPAVLMVTHDADEALRLADRVVLMSPAPGRLVDVLRVELPRPRPVSPAAGSPLLDWRRELVGRLLASADMDRPGHRA